MLVVRHTGDVDEHCDLELRSSEGVRTRIAIGSDVKPRTVVDELADSIVTREPCGDRELPALATADRDLRIERESGVQRLI